MTEMELDDAVSVTFPLRGEWVALHTPAECVPSHGTDHFGQRYAFDFARLLGRYDKAYRTSILRHLFAVVKVEDCYGWGQIVLAPFEGEVVAAGDGWPDRGRLNFMCDLVRTSLLAQDASPKDYRPLTGNYVFIEGQPGVAVLAHLRSGSVRVHVGQSVREGEPLGEIGNSGNSTLPHLHFQVMDGRDPFKANGIPCKFHRYQRYCNEVWEDVLDSIPQALEHIRVLD